MNREQIEFAISRYLDGDLSAGEIAQLELSPPTGCPLSSLYH